MINLKLRYTVTNKEGLLSEIYTTIEDIEKGLINFNDFIIVSRDIYSGFTDINGQDVYTNDLMECQVTNDFKFTNEYYELSESERDEVPLFKNINSIVVYRHGCIEIEDSHFGWEGENLIHINRSKLIGNIKMIKNE